MRSSNGSWLEIPNLLVFRSRYLACEMILLDSEYWPIQLFSSLSLIAVLDALNLRWTSIGIRPDRISSVMFGVF